MAPASFTAAEVAARAGVEEELVGSLVSAGILVPGAHGGLSVADVRRAGIVRAMVEAGLPIEGLAEAMRRGLLSLDFVESRSTRGSGASPTRRSPRRAFVRGCRSTSCC